MDGMEAKRGRERARDVEFLAELCLRHEIELVAVVVVAVVAVVAVVVVVVVVVVVGNGMSSLMLPSIVI